MKTYEIPAVECAEQQNSGASCFVENGVGSGAVGYFTSPFNDYFTSYARFAVNLPKSVTILSAKVQSCYTAIGSSTAWTASLRINEADNQTALTGRNLRTLTWTQPASMLVSGFTAGAYNDSPDYTAAINAVFTRPGFLQGYSMLLQWYYGDGDKTGNETYRLVNVTGGSPPKLILVTNESTGKDQFHHGLGFGLGRGIR